MNTSYNGDHIDLSGGEFQGPVVGKQVHHHYAAHQVHWPIRVGAIPEEADHYQHRTIADQLDEALNSFGTVELRQILSGTGGVGKTQLAAHHARTLARITHPEERVDALVWVSATSRERITSSYAHAARQLYPTVPDDPEEAAQLFLTWLRDPNKHQNRRWLIVWDDLADPTVVKDLWPPHDQPHGRVLVTTRRRDHSLNTQGRCLLNVDVYTPGEARTFLIHALTNAGIPHNNQDLVDLSRALGLLPLALGQAVTYMAELGMGCTDYLQLFHDRIRTLNEVFPDWESPIPLATTWELSIQQADTFAPRGVARPLMGLIALLDGQSIPESVLTTPPVLGYLAAHRVRDEAATPTPPVPVAPELTPYEVRSTLASLRRLNLITLATPPPDGEEVRLGRSTVGAHQLVQRATREHTTTRPNRHSVRTLADSLVKAWPEVERDTNLVQQLHSSTAVLRSHPSAEGRTSEDWLWEPDGHVLLFSAGRSLGEAGRVREAVAYWQRMARASGQRLSPDHPNTLTTRSNLAYWRGKAGDPSGAAQAYEDVVTDHLRVLGPNHPDTLATRAIHAHWLGEAGNPAKAIASLEDLLADSLRVLGPNHPHTLATRGNHAHWQGEAGDAPKAAAAYASLLTEMLHVLGPNHPDSLTARGNLARWRGKAGDPSEAVQAFQSLLTDCLRVLGPDHPYTLTARFELGKWTYRCGYFTKGIKLLRALMDDQIRTLGPDHPDTKIRNQILLTWQGKLTDSQTNQGSL